MRGRDLDALTAREREVLDFIRRGLTNEEIAQRLGISLDGAKYHVSQILSKLGVATREEAAAITLGERRRWWAGWSLWAKIAGAATVAVAVGGLAVLIVAVLGARSEEDPRASLALSSNDSAGQLANAVKAMEGAESYHFDVTLSPPANYFETTNRWAVDYVAPEEYRVISVANEGTEKTICQTYSTAENSGEVCHNAGLESVTRTRSYEGVWAADRVLFRECNQEEACDSWREASNRDLPAPLNAGPVWLPYAPSALIAASSARDLQLVGLESSDGHELIHLRGSFNPARAFAEADTKVFAGTTLEEGRNPYEEVSKEIEQYDSEPKRIEIWISPTDSLIHRIQAYIPSDFPGESPARPEVPIELQQEVVRGDVLVEYAYSGHNETAIQVPSVNSSQPRPTP